MIQKNRVRRLYASGFQGLAFDEPLPARLLLSGPNGAGKTARLRALRLAIAGTDKDGLQPFMLGAGEALVGLAADSGFALERRTKVKATEDGGIAISNTARVTPSMGEKTAEQVAKRVERELQPNLLALELDALWSKSAKERRRALLAALGSAGQTPSWKDAQARLDGLLGENEAWAGIRGAVGGRFGPEVDALEYLALVEGAAKAAASEARQAKVAAESLAREVLPAETRSLDVLRATQAEREQEVTRLEAAKASASTLGRERARLEGERLRLLAQLPEKVVRGASAEEWERELAPTVAGLELARKDLEGWKRQAREAGEAQAKAKKKAQRLKATVDRWQGRVDGLEALLEAEPADAEDADEGRGEGQEHELASACPLCGHEGFEPEAGARLLEHAKESLSVHRGKLRTAEQELRGKDEAWTEAQASQNETEQAVDGLESAEKALRRLEVLETELATNRAGAEGAFDAEALTAAQDRLQEAKDAVEEASKAEGTRGAQRGANAKAEEADRKRQAAEVVQAEAGPAGLAGELLRATVEKLEASMDAMWSRRSTLPGREGGQLRIELQDARGNPDAQLCLLLPGGSVKRTALSSGERAYATGVLIQALANFQPERQTFALLEAGEVDGEQLDRLLSFLRDAAVDTVVVETHLPISGPEHLGFEVRNLPTKAAS